VGRLKLWVFYPVAFPPACRGGIARAPDHEPLVVSRPEGTLEVTMVNPYAGTVRAPEFPTDREWLNTSPLRMSDLRGKLVILDFWTYG